ncbi:fatty acid--CoA ligase family protein [Streptomyces sp. NPDC096311]|uniref:ANL family adenylate-forming protein n=1 Tax=Streptomyces sp. NPDC096311 TaxID=3366083 RepID=UPI00381798EB
MPILRYLESPLDDLLRRAAARDADAPAVTVAGAGAGVSFAALDREADRIAHYVRRAAGRAGAVVAAAATLDAVFPAVYYGTVRSGHPLALLDPLMGPAALYEVCSAAGAEIAFVPAALAGLLAGLGDRLPLLHTVVLTDAPADAATDTPAGAGGGVPMARALAPVPAGVPARTPAPGVDTVACLQFAPDGAGRLNGVRLTHRNLLAGAAQTALAHRLGPSSVVLNHLPRYHAVHLNSAVHAGARQVLCPDPDPFGALEAAARADATHFYAPPARLHRLAGDTRLGGAGARTGARRLSALHVSGGALEPGRARRLRDALRVPVLQGYGLTEVGALSHHQPPGSRPGLGAVGVPLPGTECRVVLPGGARPAPVWSTGQVQIRGPQLSPGPAGAAQDADGWLSTGDAGYLDADGGLHLVDAPGSVFTCDDALVAPAVVERVIGQDPRVADCIVADWPDPARGALVWAGVVLREMPPGDGCGLLDVLDSVAAQANARLGPGEQIRRLEALDAVPRRPGGRPARRELRRRLHALAAVEAAA